MTLPSNSPTNLVETLCQLLISTILLWNACPLSLSRCLLASIFKPQSQTVQSWKPHLLERVTGDSGRKRIFVGNLSHRRACRGVIFKHLIYWPSFPQMPPAHRLQMFNFTELTISSTFVNKSDWLPNSRASPEQVSSLVKDCVARWQNPRLFGRESN